MVHRQKAHVPVHTLSLLHMQTCWPNCTPSDTHAWLVNVPECCRDPLRPLRGQKAPLAKASVLARFQQSLQESGGSLLSG